MLTVELERLGLQRGDTVLDLGCGEGRHVHGLQMLGYVRAAGADLDEAALAKAREGALALAGGASDGFVFLAGDAAGLPFADASFAAVICSEVLEHLPDHHAALREITRVLKPGGMFAASVPNAWPERLCWRLAPGAGGYAGQPGGHVRIFSERELRGAITIHGFTSVHRHLAHGLHAPFWWLKCALWSRRDDHPLIGLYHRLLVWDLMQRPWVTRAADALLTPLMGKSLVLYFRKSGAA